MRLHITFAKQGALRYTGHLDLHHIWERTARRAELPLSYSKGFHPQPKINLAAALPLGFASRCEVLDMRLDLEIPLEGLRERIQAAVPAGLQILEVRRVEEKMPPLQTRVESAEYEVTLKDPLEPQTLAERVRLLLEAASLPRARRGKDFDMRPLIESLVAQDGERLFMRLAARPSATGRPEELLEALGIPADSTRIERIRLIFRD